MLKLTPGPFLIHHPRNLAADCHADLRASSGQVDMLQAPTAPPAPGDTCCTPPPPPETSTAIVHPPSPLEKDFEGVRDVNVSVALMEEFMQCVAACPPALSFIWVMTPAPCSCVCLIALYGTCRVLVKIS